MPQTEQIEKRMEELRQAESAAKERAWSISRRLKLNLEADPSLTARDRYLTLVWLAEEFSFLARTWGRAF